MAGSGEVSRLVIVVTATAYGMPYAHPQVDRMMPDYILPAVLGHQINLSYLLGPNTIYT
ncbi:MAG TPA: hypothetical protein VMH27_10035 [Puia sp.]|nr:hypothetical protein [Puia sp.]